MNFLKPMWILFLLIFFGCEQTKQAVQPEILTAEYSMVTNGEFERGYQVLLEFKTDHDLATKAIVLNNRKFIFKEKGLKSDCCYLIDYYFPVESRMIQDFEPPEPDKRADGIIFELNGKDYFYNINFKLN